jgi:hypothetical protein
MLAAGLGVQVDEITESYELEPAPEDIEVATGVIAKGTVAAMRFQITGVVAGEPVIVVEHVTRMRPDLRPDWAQPAQPGGSYRVEITGEPSYVVDICPTSEQGDHNYAAILAAAGRIVNAIPKVIAAPAGIRTTLDLPLGTGKGLCPGTMSTSTRTMVEVTDPLASSPRVRPARRSGRSSTWTAPWCVDSPRRCTRGHRLRNGQSGFGELSGILEASVGTRSAGCSSPGLLVARRGYLAGDSLTDLEALGDELFHSRVLPRLFPMMAGVVAAHQERGHTVALSSSALTMHARPVGRTPGHHPPAVQSLRGRRGRPADRSHRPPHHLGPEQGPGGHRLCHRQRHRSDAELLLRRRHRGSAGAQRRRPSARGQPAARAGGGRRPQRLAHPAGQLRRGAPVVVPHPALRDAMIARTVRRHRGRPQSAPAPHAAATCLVVHAPASTASMT